MITAPLLATKLDDLKKVVYPVLCTPKLDGIRVLKVNGHVLTRNFKPLPNLYVRRCLEEHLPDGIDGEVLLDVEANFNDIQSKIMSVSGRPGFRYEAFDYVKEDLRTPYWTRIIDLNHWYQTMTYPGFKVKILVPEQAKNEEQLLELESRYFQQGYEGLMLRRPDSRYKCGRSTVNEGILLKMKRFEDFEAIIVGVEEKMKNNNEKEEDAFGRAKRASCKANLEPAGTLGALIVDDIQTGLRFNVGTGFDDKTREELWLNRVFIIGRTIKYKCQKFGQKEKPRFPVFLGFRPEGS